jgi:hypothetical protein
MITPPLTCDPGRADRVNLPHVLSSHEEAPVRCAKARPGSNSSSRSQAPVKLDLPPSLPLSEQYNVLSAYIEPNLTGESHELGSSNGLVVIDGRTTFSKPLANSNKFKQYVSLHASTGRAKQRFHSWVVPSCLSFGRLTCATRPWSEDFSCLHPTK